MSFERYLFEHSYLTNIVYNPIGCSLRLNLDAKITFEHPNAQGVSNLEDSFEEISILFEGVQYLRMINSLHLLSNPNEDYGSIEQLQLKSSNSLSQGLSIDQNEDNRVMVLDLSDGNLVTVSSASKSLLFLNFVSEMISFEIGFENYSIAARD
jgi:hypothetical protein